MRWAQPLPLRDRWGDEEPAQSQSKVRTQDSQRQAPLRHDLISLALASYLIRPTCMSPVFFYVCLPRSINIAQSMSVSLLLRCLDTCFFLNKQTNFSWLSWGSVQTSFVWLLCCRFRVGFLITPCEVQSHLLSGPPLSSGIVSFLFKLRTYILCLFLQEWRIHEDSLAL